MKEFELIHTNHFKARKNLETANYQELNPTHSINECNSLFVDHKSKKMWLTTIDNGGRLTIIKNLQSEKGVETAFEFKASDPWENYEELEAKGYYELDNTHTSFLEGNCLFVNHINKTMWFTTKTNGETCINFLQTAHQQALA
ncbi:hypothetical protein SAMN04489761_4253 [Tenacibaculum sp. MAR_2009_124]|uniref:hypothetical protein n=1 Tax=Tenacibaculum sp. MAR_2009_124 TaxID=1250059 RepID=UPI00089A5FD4|nr:hypothetical protein [Tenacibaculum sp. MAR_2009_124]SED09410.1 hypothetical protein SAMN04489761_4253 [Tenacibaculum sp. MAR_2009_124]